jgi:cytochrome c peroxidase
MRAATIVALLALTGAVHADPTVGEPPEILLGNRLFDETRFAQYFWAHSGGDANTPLAAGDPAVDDSQTTGAPLPGPFAGQSMNCRACHMDVEQKGVPGGGGRNYADFARRSPIPSRDDGLTVTVRNSQQLLNASLPRPGAFALHFDGEFASIEDLVVATLTGRNLGWYPDERALAVAHIAAVVRGDDGRGALAHSFGGGTYAGVLRGTDPLAPTSLPIPTARTLDVMRAGDEELLRVVASFIADYVRSLVASRNAAGAFNLSPYDVFLQKNGLPPAPRPGEPEARYTRRLARSVARLEAPRFVDEADGRFLLHEQAFRFGPEELAGLRLFLAGRARRSRGGVGNCSACHPAPTFTDFGFHNTGVAQEEYDLVHGDGAFTALAVPDLATRNADPSRFLPASASHPRAPAPFRAVPAAGQPGLIDLGLWNVFLNPDLGDRVRQSALTRAVCRSLGARACARRRDRPAAMLAAAVALFKTPGLRDLGHSGPYMHNGRFDTLEDVVDFYRRVGAQARTGAVRNASPELMRVALEPADVAPLAAFLRALNEDFE